VGQFGYRASNARDFQSFWNGTPKTNLIQASIIGRTDPPGGTNFRPSMWRSPFPEETALGIGV